MRRVSAIALIWLVTLVGAGRLAVPSAQILRGVVDWQFHDTDHFEIVYPRGLDADVERLGRDFERVYEQVSSDLGHDLPFTPMLVLFATRGELERITTSGLLLPAREHITLSLDGPHDRLTGALAHELGHTFLFDLLPRSVVNDLPLWFSEGLAEHERGVWDETDLATLGEIARGKSVPRISGLAPLGLPEDPVLNRTLGHAAFDFVAARWGKRGVRTYVFSLRERATLEHVYRTAFGLTPGEFDRGFETYLKERFPPNR